MFGAIYYGETAFASLPATTTPPAIPPGLPGTVTNIA